MSFLTIYIDYWKFNTCMIECTTFQDIMNGMNCKDHIRKFTFLVLTLHDKCSNWGFKWNNGIFKIKKKNYLGFGIEFNFKGLVFEWYLYCELN